MEIKVNDKEKVFLIAAIVGFIAFFLPWIGGGSFGQPSGYDLMIFGKDRGESKSWFLLLLPISFLIVVLAKLKLIKNVNPTLLKIFELIPIVLILFSIFKIFELTRVNFEDLGKASSDILQIFKIGFLLTLVSSVILIFSPVSSPTNHALTNNYESNSKKRIDYGKTSKELGEKINLASTSIAKKANAFYNWLKENPKLLYVIAALALALIAIWLIFIKNYPKRDAKNLAVELCECYSIYEKETEDTYKVFLNEFSNQNYTKRSDARGELSSIINSTTAKNRECVELINRKSQSIQSKYDYEERMEFDMSYLESQANCTNTSTPKISSLYTEIQTKIESIKDPEPNQGKIKEDLIGNTIPGWNFLYLSEFKDFKIVNTTKASERIEYKVLMKLLDEGKQMEHDCEAVVIYNRTYDGWKFSNVKMNYITYVNTFYPEKWTQITPIKNCKFNCEDTYKIVWKTGYYGREIITGPDAQGVTLPNSSSYYIKSREGKEVNVKFTYRPVNNN